MRENLSLAPPSPEVEEGPLLAGLLAAYRANEEALEPPELGTLAKALIEQSRDLGTPLVWPVGEAAQRLAGAAAVLADRRFQLRGWADEVRGRPVLLVSMAAATPIEITEACKLARALGASAVHARGWNVNGPDAPALRNDFDSVVSLDSGLSESRVTLVAS